VEEAYFECDSGVNALAAIKNYYTDAEKTNLVSLLNESNCEAKIGGTYYLTLAEAIAEGGEVTVLKEVTLTEGIVIPADAEVILDLNGQTITAGNQGQYLLASPPGSTLILSGDGVVNAGKGFFASGENARIIIDGGTYNTSVSGTLNNVKHTSLVQGGSMVINDGTFTTNVEDAVLFWATSNGRLEINGGFFENTADDTPDLLGVGTNGSNTNRIIIKGGTFVNYNPLNDQMTYTGAWPAAGEAAFGGPWILIPGDYQVVSETQSNGDIWYSVVPR